MCLALNIPKFLEYLFFNMPLGFFLKVVIMNASANTAFYYKVIGAPKVSKQLSSDEGCYK